jgi:hypothetical protein
MILGLLSPSVPPLLSVKQATHKRIEKERQLDDGRGGGGGKGAKSYDSEKAWSSLIDSILSAQYVLVYALSSAYRETLKNPIKVTGSTEVCTARPTDQCFCWDWSQKSHFQVCKQKRN